MRDSKFSVEPGKTRSWRSGSLLALAWRAETKKKALIMVSSACSAKPVAITTRRETVHKPAVVNAYNHSMNSVDISDQLTVFYSFVRRTRKWWRKLFFYLLETSVVNSYLLYRLSVTSPRSHLGYRRAIVDQIATLYLQMSPVRAGPGAPRRVLAYSTPQRLDKKPHFLGKSSSH